MGNMTKINRDECNEFPDGKIVLLDGRTLDCYPVAGGEDVVLEDDRLKLDLTGKYLSVGNRPKKAKFSERDSKESNCEVSQLDLFLKNAFYLLSHKERILSDSRMFLCPIHVHNGLAYTGTSGFRKPTLGIYLEWWMNCDGTLRTDNEGRKTLLYHLAGSPLSGLNSCSEVDEQGKTYSVRLSSFKNYWPRFMNINTRYSEAKSKYQAYTLQQVLDILEHEANANYDYTHAIEIVFMKNEITTLNRRLDNMEEERNHWRNMYYDTLTKYNDEKIRKFYAEYEIRKAETDAEIASLREKKRLMKADLKCGKLDNISYQRQLTPLKSQIQELELKLSDFRCRRVREVFPEGDIRFTLIEEYMRKTRNKEESETNKDHYNIIM